MLYEVITNLKQLRLQLPDDEEQETFVYEFTGPAEIKGADLMKDKALRVFNPATHLMSLMDGVKLEVELQVDLGRGYVPSEVNEKYIEAVGTIPMDAIFSPVSKARVITSYSIHYTKLYES